MSKIIVKFRDDTQREFERQEWDGKITFIKYETGTVIICDPFGTRTAFPLDLVSEIIEEPR